MLPSLGLVRPDKQFVFEKLNYFLFLSAMQTTQDPSKGQAGHPSESRTAWLMGGLHQPPLKWKHGAWAGPYLSGSRKQ